MVQQSELRMDAVALANTRAQKLAVCREGEPVNRFPISDNAFWSWFSCLENQKNISFKQRFLLFEDPAFVCWCLRWNSNSQNTVSLERLLSEAIPLEAKRDFSLSVNHSNGWKQNISLVAQISDIKRSLGVVVRAIALKVKGLDPDQAQALATLALIPWIWHAGLESKSLLRFMQAKAGGNLDLNHFKVQNQIIAGALTSLGLPEWCFTFNSTLELSSALISFPKNLAKIWHSVRVGSWMLAPKLKSIVSISDQLLVESCEYLGLERAQLIEPGFIESQNSIKLEIQNQNSLPNPKAITLSLWGNSNQSIQQKSNEWLSNQNQVFRLYLTGQKKHLDAKIDKIRGEIVSELAGGAGHEINNPLAILIGRVQGLIREKELLFKPEKREEGGRNLASINEQAQRINFLIRKLMRVGRPGIGKPSLIYFQKQAENLLVFWKNKAADQAIPLRIRFDKSIAENAAIEIDPEFLKTILDELLKNAFAHVCQNGRVDLTVSDKNGKFCLDVQNDGELLSPHVVKHLFDPFFSHHRAGRCPGLGLPLARSLARVNQGELVLLKDGSKGKVCFRLSFPFAQKAISKLPKRSKRLGSNEKMNKAA